MDVKKLSVGDYVSISGTYHTVTSISQDAVGVSPLHSTEEFSVHPSLVEEIPLSEPWLIHLSFTFLFSTKTECSGNFKTFSETEILYENEWGQTLKITRPSDNSGEYYRFIDIEIKTVRELQRLLSISSPSV